MTIKDLMIPRPALPQCRFKVASNVAANEAWRRQAEEQGKNPDYCRKPASYEIDGVPYCKSHAGKKALQILMEQE